jgi:hypothetical protein
MELQEFRPSWTCYISSPSQTTANVILITRAAYKFLGILTYLCVMRSDRVLPTVGGNLTYVAKVISHLQSWRNALLSQSHMRNKAVKRQLVHAYARLMVPLRYSFSHGQLHMRKLPCSIQPHSRHWWLYLYPLAFLVMMAGISGV